MMVYVEVIKVEEILSDKLEDMGYVIYIRKSTDDPKKQVQSLEDQLISCFNYAKNKGLKLAPRDKYANEFDDNTSRAEVKNFIRNEAKQIYEKYFVVLEKESAKKPYNRRKWRKIIEWIKNQKIVWIISYHPDRQARNLVEAGEIVELYDNKLVDLKYPTFYVDNSSTWKMLLWILFILSKHFSDKLSDDVKRWVIANKLKWLFKWHRKPYWYIVGKDGRLKIDPKYWPLIKHAFKMKLEGAPHKDIIAYLNRQKIKFRKEDTNWNYIEEDVVITNNILSNILYNWLYAWILDYMEDGVLKRIHLYNDPDINFPVFISLAEFKKILMLKESKNKGRYQIISTQPLPYWFFITSENKKCSFYIQSKRKKKFLELLAKWEDVKEEDFLKQITITIKYKLTKIEKYEYMRKENNHERKLNSTIKF